MVRAPGVGRDQWWVGGAAIRDSQISWRQNSKNTSTAESNSLVDKSLKFNERSKFYESLFAHSSLGIDSPFKCTADGTINVRSPEELDKCRVDRMLRDCDVAQSYVVQMDVAQLEKDANKMSKKKSRGNHQDFALSLARFQEA